MTTVQVVQHSTTVQVVEDRATVESVPSSTTIIATGGIGPRGPKGDTGPQGDDGQPGTSSFHFTQGVATDVWVITHDLGYFPAVTIVDSGGTTVVGDITYDSISQITVTFAVGFSGDAYLS